MKVALIQINATDDKRRNLDRALRLTFQAIRKKAQFILLPEVFNFRGRTDTKKGYLAMAESIPGESTIPFMILARANKVFILAGSLYERARGTKKARLPALGFAARRAGKVYNTSVLINHKGKIVARYRKIHLFDARLKGKTIQESKYLLSGTTLATANIQDFKIGLSICYDLRFPVLYQRYKKMGVDILTVPSSFTKPTGEAHWEILLRARAVENLCFILAPNQFGKTKSGVVTYGNSMVIDPWGKVIARASGNQEEIIYATLGKEVLKKVRKKLPRIVG